VTYTRKAEADQTDEYDLRPGMRIEAHYLRRVRPSDAIILLLLLSLQSRRYLLCLGRHIVVLVAATGSWQGWLEGQLRLAINHLPATRVFESQIKRLNDPTERFSRVVG